MDACKLFWHISPAWSEVPVESTQVMPQWVNSNLLWDSKSADVGKLGGSGTF